MKNIFPILFLAFLFSCHSESKVPDKKVADPNFIADSSKQRLLQIIEGGWVNEDYISRLKKTNSPMGACDNLMLEEFSIDTSNMRGDTLFYSNIFSLSGTKQKFNIAFSKSADGKIIMKIVDRLGWSNQLCLNFSINNSDTTLFFLGKNKINLSNEVFERTYTKIPARDTIYLSPIEYAVNKNLFAGEWKLNGKIIFFANDGTVKKYKSYTRYSVKIWDENPVSSPDEISFYNASSEETFAFTITGNKMQLYKINQLNDLTFERGKLVYEFERVQ